MEGFTGGAWQPAAIVQARKTLAPARHGLGQFPITPIANWILD
jgi:hypothetical protein